MVSVRKTGYESEGRELNFLLQGTNNIGINHTQTNLGGLVSSSWHTVLL